MQCHTLFIALTLLFYNSAANEVYDHVEEIVCTNHHSSMLRLANNVWSCYPHDKNQNIKYTRLPLPSFKNTKCYDLVVCGYTLSTNLNDLRRELIAEAAWNLTKKILIFVEFGTPHGVKCINRAKEIIVRKNKNRSPEDTANVIAPDPHGVVLSSLNPEFYIFERRVAVPTTLKKPFALLTSKHYSIVKYSYLVIIRGNPPNNADRVNHLVKRSILDENMSLLSSVTDTELADASFTWPRILYTNVVRPSNIILKLSCISADCVDLQIAKNEESYSRAAALLARSSRPGGLWPLL